MVAPYFAGWGPLPSPSPKAGELTCAPSADSEPFWACLTCGRRIVNVVTDEDGAALTECGFCHGALTRCK